MPHKGFYTQGLFVLTEGPLAIGEIDGALSSFEVVGRKPASPSATFDWMGDYETWVVPFREEVNGYILIDVLPAPWPDAMGDPKTDPRLFGAWSMGTLGPFAYPGNLERAVRMTRMTGRGIVADAVTQHRAMVRIRTSYVLGAGDDAKVMPDDYDPRHELDSVTAVARAILRVAGAICYFNPNGEVLYAARQIDEMLTACPPQLPPVPLWCGQRLLQLKDHAPWMFADTVGMQQLDALDHEACFRQGEHDVNEVMGFLRNCAQYTLDAGPVIRTDNTIDGPGGIWRAIELDEALLPAPRPVIRWYPDAAPRPPAVLINPKPPTSSQRRR